MRKYFIIIIILTMLISCTSRESSAKVKQSNLAGRWYSSDGSELSRQIDALMKGSEQRTENKDAVALILPHAGYVYSGKTAAAGYRLIGTRGQSTINPDIIVIMGPSHHSGFHGCSLLDADYFETPLGKVKINREIGDKLLKDNLFIKNPSAFEQEHSIEIQLPFLQRIFGAKLNGDVQVLPILVGELDDSDARRAAGTIAASVAGSSPLFIVSTDFTHYGPNFGYEPFRNDGGQSISVKLKELDGGAIDLIVKKDMAGFSRYVEKTGITICGRNPIKIALALPVTGFKAEKLAYDTSGNITGDYGNSVSYAAILFSGKLAGAASKKDIDSSNYTAKEKNFLLKAARDNIRSWLTKGRGIRFFPTNVPARLLEKRGVFVTLKKQGDLRGCIGYLTGLKPLVQAVLDNSYNAAFKDPRFNPITADELADITIEISVLTEPVLIKSVDEIKIGRDGLIVERGAYRGLLLPQVATEQGWDRDTFLDHTCLKAGLPAGSWKDGVTKLYRFQAIVFGEDGK
jgi:AmmeMemoRadiSam system protein B/AmmeMemoRadiSam system protein A